MTKRVTLATSVPPVSRRVDTSGLDIGDIYQRQCLSSWAEAGVRLISVNARDEAEVVREKFPDLEIHSVDRDGREFFRRPLIYLSDVFQALRASDTEFVGIVNADILLRAHTDMLDEFYDRLDEGRMLVANRFEVADISLAHGFFYNYGFDLFVFHKSVLESFSVDDFLLGVPWWDYWLPINAKMLGLKVDLFRSSCFCHLTHDQRWDNDLWLSGLNTLVTHFKTFSNFEMMQKADQVAPGIAMSARFGDFIVNSLAPTGNSAYCLDDARTALGVGLGVFLVSEISGHKN